MSDNHSFDISPNFLVTAEELTGCPIIDVDPLHPIINELEFDKHFADQGNKLFVRTITPSELQWVKAFGMTADYVIVKEINGVLCKKSLPEDIEI